MLPQPPQEATDIFSLSDQVLADRLQFIKEIGFGNWGSVWLCHPKSGRTKEPQKDVQVAVKLVHRSKTTTTAARVRSLWNEMKIVRTFKDDPHPSIVPFHSFIITPSYALITMDYLPDLVPVEVPEPKAKEWFLSLLSGVQFLHQHGVVHNDIKPANILLSTKRVPVLVDFGFAEKYDVNSSKAFHSNLTYGTPEYLSPERARGLPHDTRKSDIWSLGVTFFEILVGRTPFEHEEGEQFATKEDLEKYWARTVRGKWVGSWKMSKSAERLLRRMIQPNADMRCVATDAMADPYWVESAESSISSHRKSASLSFASSGSESKLMDIISPWSTRRLSKDPHKDKERKPKAARPPAADKENAPSPSPAPKTKKELPAGTGAPAKLALARANHARSQSQPKVQPPAHAESPLAKRRPALFGTLAPIRGSPPATPTAGKAKDKENALARDKENGGTASAARRAARKPLPPVPGARGLGHAPRVPSKDMGARKPAPLVDLTEHVRNAENARGGARVVGDKAKEKENRVKEKEQGRRQKGEDRGMGSVRDRMREWEREREKLRELVMLGEGEKGPAAEPNTEKEEDEEKEEEEGEEERAEEAQAQVQAVVSEATPRRSEERLRASELQPGLPRLGGYVSEAPGLNVPATPMSPDMNASTFWGDSFSRSGNESGLSILRQSLKMSIDKTMLLYKSSIGQKVRRSSQAQSSSPDHVLDTNASARQSWEDDELIQQANSSLPVVRQAVRNERVGADSRADRMTIWIQNVEKVVEETRQNFASSSITQLPPLPIAPLSTRRSSSQNRSNRSSRLPRKVLAASQIFQKENEQPSDVSAPAPAPADTSMLSASTSMYAAANASALLADVTLPTIPSEEPSRVGLVVGSTPPRARRATVMFGLGRSPEKSRSLDMETGSPSRKEKSESQNDLSRPISPVSKLQFELERLSQPTPPLRLSAVVDKSLFVANKADVPPTPPLPANIKSPGNDSLTASPLHVEPYPARAPPRETPTIDTPTRHRVEGIYDRFLMATSGVKRVGRGYQSDNYGPTASTPSSSGTLSSRKSAPRMFHSTRRPMPPPVSSDDKRTVSVDELGIMQSTHTCADTPMFMSKDDRTNTVRNVRRAIKAIVTGKTVTKAPLQV